MNAKKLTPKQHRFVEEYLIDLNSTKTAVRAGYSEKTARQIGSENLSKLAIQEAIARAKRDRSEATKIDAEWWGSRKGRRRTSPPAAMAPDRL